MKILMEKTISGYLAPINEEEAEHLKKLKIGGIVECEVVRKRNPDFHRRYFALLKVGFDAWSETAPMMQYLGERVMPNFEQFRRDIAVLAGHYEPVFNLKGELRMVPKSISFASMDQDEFEALFSTTINVVLRRVLTAHGFTEESLRAHVDRVLEFDK